MSPPKLLASLGDRLLATEGFFVQRLLRIPKLQTPVSIEWVRTPDLAARLGKVTRSRPIASDPLRVAPFRQYVALDGEDIVGRVRSFDAAAATWCADMYVGPSHRRCGIGPRAADQNVARRPGVWFQVLGADGISHGGAPLSTRGL